MSDSLGRHAIEAGARPDGVIVGPPVLDDLPSMGDVTEWVHIQAFVTEPPVENLDEPVLLWLARHREYHFSRIAQAPAFRRKPGVMSFPLAAPSASRRPSHSLPEAASASRNLLQEC